MRVILFGLTGMVGQGVLRECVLDPRVERVQTVGRRAPDVQHQKLRHLVHTDLLHYEAIENELAGYDACFFCLGISAAGTTKAVYEQVTYDFTLAAATILAGLSPDLAFIYVSGAGTDSTEQGRMYWARVKGRTENALLRLPLRVYIFRPGFIEPVHGARSKTAWYRALYAFLSPLTPLLRRAFPDLILTSEQVGLAMIAAATQGSSHFILESKDIRALASRT